MLAQILLLSINLFTSNASAESMEWNFESRSPYKAQLSFFSASGNREWPGGGKAHLLDEWRDYQYILQCTPGESICFGATTVPNLRKSWGVGIHNDKNCTGCCITCGSGPVKMVLE